MIDYTTQSTVTQTLVASYVCPSEINAQLTANVALGLSFAPTSYGR